MAESRRAGVERAVFDRAPVTVPLPVGIERLITLPAPAALHVPSDMARVARLEAIDRTIYATALAPFTPIRIVAELIDTGQQIPIDLVANDGTASARAELEVFAVDGGGAPAASAPAGESAASADAGPGKPALDMVELTRYAARQLYAPRRLAATQPGIEQVDVSAAAAPGLIRGLDVDAVPVGQWRAGQLYVTAVRVTNRSRYAAELPLEDIRGRWLAATAQHGRIGPAGSETDTTAVYLVCERAFEACLN
jgi:integrating conjugative element protein (TIGR03749 family)